MIRLLASLGVFLVWITITVVGQRLFSGSNTSLLDIVTGGIAWPILAAATFLLAMIRLTGWPDIGLGAPVSARSLLVLWLPVLYIAAFLAIATASGMPPLPVIGMILLNCALASLSEELMFRGILLQSARTVLAFWPAVLGSTLVFGAAHSLNVVLTGELAPALVQSAAAFISGLVFAAIRLCTGSIWPSVVTHGLWNAGMFLMLAAGDGAMLPDAPEGTPMTVTYLLAVLLVLPEGLYAIWLLRRYRRSTIQTGI
jgi:membrane protease YdiL (CAAX protease family)